MVPVQAILCHGRVARLGVRGIRVRPVTAPGFRPSTAEKGVSLRAANGWRGEFGFGG